MLDSVSNYHKAIETWDMRREPFFALADYYDTHGDLERALIYYHAAYAIEFKPQGYLNNMFLYGDTIPNRIGKIYARMGKYELSRKWWIEANKYMKKRILMIIPTRERAEKVKRTVDSWKEYTENMSDLMLAVDDNDPQLEEYKKIQGIKLIIGSPMRMVPSLNRAFQNNPDYQYYGFMGDDHIFRSHWEIRMIETLGNKGIGYGNDLHQGKNLPTAVVMTANIPKKLGYMAPPALFHMYPDNYWFELGRGLNRLFYIPEIIIEHDHPHKTGAPMDERYLAVNNNEVIAHDREVFTHWDIPADVQKCI